MSDDAYKELQGLTRMHAHWLWQAAKAGMPLEGEQATMAQAMLEHTEYYDVWDRLSEFGDEDLEVDGVNPLMHITIHSTIENQLAAGHPSSVGRALRRLLRQGLSRHEAIHRIGAVLAQEIWEILRDDRPFDAASYNRAMRHLGRQPPPRPTKKRKRRKKRR